MARVHTCQAKPVSQEAGIDREGGQADRQRGRRANDVVARCFRAICEAGKRERGKEGRGSRLLAGAAAGAGGRASERRFLPPKEERSE